MDFNICDLPLIDRHAIATSLCYLELANTKHEEEGLTPLDLVSATNQVMQNFAFEDPNSWKLVEYFRGISGEEAIELAQSILNYVLIEGY